MKYESRYTLLVWKLWPRLIVFQIVGQTLRSRSQGLNIMVPHGKVLSQGLHI